MKIVSKRYSGSFLVLLVSLVGCSAVQKKSMTLPVLEPARESVPVLIQFDDADKYDPASIRATYYTGTEGKDRRTDREYAKFPILVGTGARSKELELEGSLFRRSSFLVSERIDFYLYLDGNNLSHNCNLGVEDVTANHPNTSKRSFRSIKLYFRGTGIVDERRTYASFAVGLITYFLYNILGTGFRTEKMDCGLILEGS
ncbi:hypothetical protein EHO60_15535 [Leptospira fletcheri]|uniref:Lipoprotein n=1 Tax=Leptospira fletcheri TaxID=2484981 RepID=A0A4V3JCK5_9LEPT|nr:hypothetical protein [Leptospira fletcheri]TGK06449.1 hypothetical protein EHO60_15535 [Leptospira fletcheri]